MCNFKVTAPTAARLLCHLSVTVHGLSGVRAQSLQCETLLCVWAVRASHKHYVSFLALTWLSVSGALASVFKTGPQRGSTLRSLKQTGGAGATAEASDCLPDCPAFSAA